MVTLIVNKKKLELDVSKDTPLLWVLRDVLNLTGTKYGCGIGVCGSCTVVVEDRAVQSCSLPIGNVEHKEIVTIEGVASDPIAQKLLLAWKETEPTQCGYCQPGQIMAALALLRKNDKPTKEDINQALSGHICRCGTYQRIHQAIKIAAGITEDE